MTTAKHKRPRRPWICWSKPEGVPALRLFCFPYAGGGPTIFRDWPLHLAPSVEVCAIIPPGRGPRHGEASPIRLEEIVDEVAEHIGATRDVPFALAGHSLGGLVAFEVARKLRQSGGVQPVHLFASASPSPQLERKDFAAGDFGEEALIECLTKWNGTPKEVLENRELMKLFLPGIRADLRAFNSHRYVHQAPLDLDITAFGGIRDRIVEERQLAAWSEQTTQAFQLVMVPGDHFFLTSHQNVFLPLFSSMIAKVMVDLPRPVSASVV